LQQEVWQMIDVDVTHRILKDTGHEFNQPQMNIVSEWLHNEVLRGPDSDGR